MKTSIFLLLFLSSLVSFANEIDSLKTPDDVLKFIKKAFNKQDRFREKLNNASTINFKFIKLDINRDGLTDILINGIHLYAVVDKGGRNNFEENYIGNWHVDYQLIKIDSSNPYPLLIVQEDDDFDRETGKGTALKPDTLINLYGGFIEYNSAPKQINFKQVKISTSRCFGTCPVFELTVYSKGQAVLNAKEYNEITGVFKSTLDSITFKKLTDLLDYLNIDSLKNNYAIGWTDNPSVDTEIQYNGIIKKYTITVLKVHSV